MPAGRPALLYFGSHNLVANRFWNRVVSELSDRPATVINLFTLRPRPRTSSRLVPRFPSR